MSKVEEIDPFLDDQFAPLAPADDDASFLSELNKLAEEDPEFRPKSEDEEPSVPAIVEPKVEAPAADEPDGPEILTLEDGSELSIFRPNKSRKKDANLWLAILDPKDGSNTEVFKGATQQEMYQRIAVAKLNATKQIRKLNKQMKLGGAPVTQVAPQNAAPSPKARSLTADEKFEIQTALSADPDVAMETWFQKKFGLSPEQLVEMLNKSSDDGKQARVTLEVESVAKAFLASTPSYHPVEHNYIAMLRYLAKNKLGKPTADPRNVDELNRIVFSLYDGGVYTVDNLTEAFEELTEAGLLEHAPAPKVETPAPAQAPSAAPPAKPRIEEKVRRPRAGLGLHSSDTSGVLDGDVTPPSAEEFDSMSDEEVAKTLQSVIQHARRTRR